MTSRQITGVLAAAAALALAACAPDVTHGTITSKQFEPQRSWVYMQPVRATRCSTTMRRSGKGYVSSRSCSTYISTYLPIVEADPACWKLNLRNGKNTGSVCVSETAWNTAKVGGTW
jgi:hypothetical protein